MWKRKEIKQNGHKLFRKYAAAFIAVTFLLAFLTNEYSSSISLIHQFNDTSIQETVEDVNNIDIDETINNVKDGYTKEEVKELVKSELNSITEQNELVRVIYSTTLKVLSNETIVTFALVLAVILELSYKVFFANPLNVGSRYFYLKASKNEEVLIRDIFHSFKKNYYLSAVKTMLLKNIYLFLWAFTIVGYFIKSYEYRMIPYILADNKNMDSKEVFKLSKKMMKGNKWKLFVFDLSFILWYIAGALTFGLLNIFYVNPYNAACNTDLYLKLKNS